ncbi:MAG: insulinase family protein [Polyangiaceae bacterium]|nr:insulinase family protein [Polyangiaceae bacterium]
MLTPLRHRAYVPLATLLCVLSISSLPSADPKKSPGQTEAPLALPLEIKRVTLDNGLRVVMNVDHASPTVAIAVTYDVGSRDEEPGKTGFAHTFEHLMFGATKNLAEGQFEALVVGRGGFLTAITAVDRTAYYMVVPENELALGLWLEAERMRFIDVSAASFEAERKVIEEEYRLRVANAPYGRAYWRTQELAFDGCFAYGHAPPGAPQDLARAKLEWVRAFHAAHYGPNTAVLSLSGDFDPDTAMTLVHRYFDDIPRIQAKPFSEPTLAEPRAERREVIQDPLARVPGLSYGFVLPKPLTREHDALRFAAMILGDGERARLPSLLVRDKALATAATASIDEYNFATGPGLLRMEIRFSQDATIAEVEKHVDAILNDLAARPPSSEEMLRARRRLETALALRLAWTRDRAIDLGKYELSFGDARLLTRAFDRFAAVTADDVQKAAVKFLDKNRRAIIESHPAPKKPDADVKTAAGGAP